MPPNEMLRLITVAPKSTAPGPALPKTDRQGFGSMDANALRKLATHRKQNSAGIGRPNRGTVTPGYMCPIIREVFDKIVFDKIVKWGLRGAQWQVCGSQLGE